MLNDNNRDDMKKSIFMIDPSIAKTNQQESTIHENYSENYGLSALGIRASSVRRNLSPTVLIEKAIRNGEGILTDTGALAVTTGKFTGRSPHDKYIVDTDGLPVIHDRSALRSSYFRQNTPVFRPLQTMGAGQVFHLHGFDLRLRERAPAIVVRSQEIPG